MTEKIIVAGAGGQGIMFLGKIIALAALKSRFKVTLLPAYGAEVRGGTSNCSVVISEAEIGSPFVRQADSIITLNEPSLNKFKNRLKEKGFLIANSSLIKAKPQIKGARIICSPFSEIASELGDIRIANIIALGAYLGGQKIISLKSVIAALKESVSSGKKDLFLLNEKAIKEGLRLGFKS